MTLKRSSEMFPRKCRNFFGGPRTETKFVKWSTPRKRLRTAALNVPVSQKATTKLFTRIIPSQFHNNEFGWSENFCVRHIQGISRADAVLLLPSWHPSSMVEIIHSKMIHEVVQM